MTPLDAFNCITPLGPAVCVGIIDGGSAVEWVTFIKSTGEPWLWRNPQFRVAPDITAGRSFVSPFKEPDTELAKHVQRYQDNGWLKNA